MFSESASNTECGVSNVGGSLSSQPCSESIVDQQQKCIISGRKRQRNDSVQTVYSELSVQKRAKLDHNIEDAEKDNETITSNDVVSTEVSNETQDEDRKKHSSSEVDEIAETKTNTEESTSTIQYEILLQTKKSDKQGFTRVSDILTNIPSELSYLNSYCKIDDSDIQKRYTRIALLRMREELSELTVADSHHAHDFFVVNFFKIFYSLHRPNEQIRSENDIFKGLSLPRDLLPLRLSAANDVVQEINKFAVFPKENVSFSDFKKSLQSDFPLNLSHMEALYKFVCGKKELGASIQELMVNE